MQILKLNKNTGLFFGSFNPIHTGHLIIANYILEYGGLDEVWFVISPLSPMKSKHTLLANHHRLALVNTATEDNLRLKACNIEFGLPEPSYTVVTLAALSEKYPYMNFSIIMGSDNLQTFDKWRNYEHILNNYSIIVYPRLDFDGGKFKKHASVKWIDAPLMQISSSFIRQALKDKKSIKYLVPDKVLDYITEMHFYSR